MKLIVQERSYNIMKKQNLFVLSFVTLSLFTIAGCGTTNNNREAELEEKITKLEQQIATLEAEKDENTTTDTSNTTDASIQTNETGAIDNNGTITENSTTNQNGTNGNTADINRTDDNQDTTTDVSSYSIDSLTKEVDKIVKKVDVATPSKDTDKKRTEFFLLKDEVNVVENRIDEYDDYLESQYKKGDITYEDYRKKEKELDALEEHLDEAEDKLERTFGMDN